MLEQMLREGLETMGISFSPEAPARFRIYYEELTKANAVMNLPAIRGEADSARLHFLDSAAPLKRFDLECASVIDVGTGAGFPGLPLKLLRPSLSLTLLDSQRKRVDFLRGLCACLELGDVELLCARAEDCSDRRERYDFAVSRAVARLRVLSELCLPFVRVGGRFLALKGPAAAEELRESERAIALLGGEAEEIFPYALPGEPTEHSVVVIRKTKETPRKYPRPFPQIKKTPL